MKANPEWHDKAREMRRGGSKITEIMAVLGKREGAVNGAVKGIKCPIDHLRIYQTKPPLWREEARRLRSEGMPYKKIAKKVGGSVSVVIRECCDIIGNLPRFVPTGLIRSAESIARSNQTKKENRVALGIQPKQRKKVEYKPVMVRVITNDERRRRMIQAAFNADGNRPKAAITLPRISILENMNDDYFS